MSHSVVPILFSTPGTKGQIQETPRKLSKPCGKMTTSWIKNKYQDLSLWWCLALEVKKKKGHEKARQEVREDDKEAWKKQSGMEGKRGVSSKSQ